MVRFIIILSFLFSIPAFTQREKPKHDATYDDRAVHFGFTLGLNVMDYTIYQNSDSLVSDVPKMMPGFHVQIVTSFRLNNYFHFRILPGLLFGERDIVFRSRYDSTLNMSMSIHPAYIQVPFLIKYKAERVNNYAPYLVAGINGMYDLSAKKEFIEDKKIYIKFKPYDVAYEFGVGIDFYMPYFKLSTELKIVNGLLNVFMDKKLHKEFPVYARSINKVNASAFLLSFHFE